jgi:hypothetical protein
MERANPAPAAATAKWLYLFSSSRSTLYEQDILNVLAAPCGSTYTFRYDDEVVDAEAKEKWGALEGTLVLVLFSIQQEAQYHEPAFVPIRRGTVTSTDKVGSRFFVDFRVEGYMGLPEPPKGQTDAYGNKVRAFTGEVREAARVTPYTASASLGMPLQHQDGEQNVLFEHISTYLSHTDSFRHARFVRFLRLIEAGATADEELALKDRPTGFELEAGRTYSLELVHSQREELSRPESFGVNVDGSVVQILGRAGFDVASRYDRPTIQLHAPQNQTLERRSTVMVVEPVPPVQGPRIEIPITVKPDRARIGVISAGQVVALLALALPAVLTGLPNLAKIGIAVVAAATAAFLQLLNVQALKPGTVVGLKPATPAPAQQHPSGG